MGSGGGYQTKLDSLLPGHGLRFGMRRGITAQRRSWGPRAIFVLDVFQSLCFKRERDELSSASGWLPKYLSYVCCARSLAFRDPG